MDKINNKPSFKGKFIYNPSQSALKRLSLSKKFKQDSFDVFRKEVANVAKKLPDNHTIEVKLEQPAIIKTGNFMAKGLGWLVKNTSGDAQKAKDTVMKTKEYAANLNNMFSKIKHPLKNYSNKTKTPLRVQLSYSISTADYQKTSPGKKLSKINELKDWLNNVTANFIN